MKRIVSILVYILAQNFSFGQGFNHQWLLGNNPFAGFPNGRAYFDLTTSSFVTEFRPMSFQGTEGNISDANGNFLMSSNGIWVANANNDTMMNGNGLNPNSFTSSWPYGQIIGYGNIFLNYPGDSTKFVLVHQTGDSINNVPSTELYYSKINMNLDSGLGGVDSNYKNVILFHDTLTWGIAACKHSNGRDWWICTIKDSTSYVFVTLISSSGITTNIQNLNFSPVPAGNVSQLTFSKDGTKFITTIYDNLVDKNSYVVLSDFDRCSGTFSNTHVIAVTNNQYLFGLAFSSSGNYIYTCSSSKIFQIDVNALSVDTVATYDGFISPGPSCCATTFWNMYLAANGKIYVTSGSSVQHLHVINFPDSAGIACDVQQHSIDLVSYLHLRAVPNHPNYYLGCDTTGGCICLTGMNNLSPPDFRFRIYPNPVINNTLNIGYLLPQNKSGTFHMYDITGKVVFKYTLPPWSNEQSFKLPELNDGVYNCVITSGMDRVSKKVAVIHE